VWLRVGEESELARSGGGGVVTTASPLGFLLAPRWAGPCRAIKAGAFGFSSLSTSLYPPPLSHSPLPL